jgi:hypothetical protein
MSPAELDWVNWRLWRWGVASENGSCGGTGLASAREDDAAGREIAADTIARSSAGGAEFSDCGLPQDLVVAEHMQGWSAGPYSGMAPMALIQLTNRIGYSCPAGAPFCHSL